jgi:hypothetical protein
MTPTVSEMNSEAPMAVMRKASGGALRFRSGRYATSSTPRAVRPEKMIAATRPSNNRPMTLRTLGVAEF